MRIAGPAQRFIAECTGAGTPVALQLGGREFVMQGVEQRIVISHGSVCQCPYRSGFYVPAHIAEELVVMLGHQFGQPLLIPLGEVETQIAICEQATGHADLSSRKHW